MTDNIDKAWEYFLKDNLQAAWDLVSDDFQLETCSDFSLLNLMLYLNLAENPQESLAICQRYIALARSQKDLENEHIGLHQLAMVYRELGQYELALAKIEAEHAIIVAYFPEDQLKLSVNNYEQGFLRFKLKRYGDAIGYLKKSLEQAQKTDDVIAQACANRGLGETYLAMKDNNLAKIHLTKALALFTEADDILGAEEVKRLLQQ
ncbi:tetratricopeptide repeat protein [Streptococcus pluranimalium]|uniref:tetratricopeptide repeat protein n=1 Tax=Streptococcus pluranimalium TaxID=82348 RepID=UPI003F68F7F2